MMEKTKTRLEKDKIRLAHGSQDSVYTSQTERGRIVDCTNCYDGAQRPESVQEIGGHGMMCIRVMVNE